MPRILFYMMIGWGLFLYSATQETQTRLHSKCAGKPGEKAGDGIRFDFTAERNHVVANIRIKGQLYNDNADTVCFLSYSCNGEQYSLRFDTTKFFLVPFYYCNASWPRLIKIAPKQQYSFEAYFNCRDKETTIDLSFDFYQVDKSFSLNKSPKNLNIFHRPKDEQEIIWAGEKPIN